MYTLTYRCYIYCLIVLSTIFFFVPVFASAQSSFYHRDIMGIASKSENFSVIVKAAKFTGLGKVLESKGPFTVLAFPNQAIRKLPQEISTTLFDPENSKRLKSILSCHIIQGIITSEDLIALKEIKAINGESLSVQVNFLKTIEIDTAKILKSDIKASNGIIHIIDTVLIPSQQSFHIAKLSSSNKWCRK